MAKQKIKLGKYIQLWGIILLVGIAFSITAIDIFASYRNFNKKTEQIRQDYVARQRQLIRREVERVVDLINRSRTRAGDNKKHIQEELLADIGQLRFGKDKNGYIFVVSYDGVTLMNGTQPNLIGKNIWDLTDPNGVKVVQEERKAVENPQGDFIYYTWNKPSIKLPAPKVSFIKGIKDWQWMVGAGVYLDDVEKELALMHTKLSKEIKERVFVISLGALFFLVLFSLLVNRLNRKVKHDTNLLTLFFQQAAFTDEEIDRDLVCFAEIDQMAASANEMVRDKRGAKQQLAMFKTVMESSRQGMGWVSIVDAKIVYVNPALATILGEKDQAAPLGKDVVATYYQDVEQQLLNEKILPHVYEHGNWSGELRLQKITGEIIPTQNNFFLIKDEEGRPLYCANIVTDITKRKEAEQEKEELAAKLHRSQKMESLGLMAGGVAHDLNNILAGIVGYPELLLQDLPADSVLREPLEIIGKSGQRAAIVVADLLTVARGAASIRERHDLNILSQDYFKSPEGQKLKDLYPEITYELSLHATTSTILCSPVHVQKCLMNLVTNGSEAITGKGRVIVSTYNEQVTTADSLGLEPGEYIVLMVQDSGGGISQHDLEHIFEPFYTRKEMGQSGSGLGLTIVWNTMADHQGKVVVDSTEQGTCFKLYFPVVRQHNGHNFLEKHDPCCRGDGQHILVVDDEKPLRDLTCRILVDLGYRVDTVASGEEALAFVRENSVDLILLDMLMEPGMNGRQTYEEIIKICPGQKVVVVSGFSESEDVKAILHYGGNGFMGKPYTLEQLAGAVCKVLFP